MTLAAHPEGARRPPTPAEEIGLADLARALAVLQPAADGPRRQIAALLGLKPRPRDVVSPVVVAGEDSAETQSPTRRDPVTDRRDRPRPRRPRAPSAALPVRATLTVLDTPPAADVPAWLDQVEPLPADADAAVPDAPPAPLVPPQYVRARLAHLLATPVAEGPADVARLVDVIARAEPVQAIPRRPIPSLRRGVQVLSDISPGMAPFAADHARLLADIDDLFGPDNVARFWFEGTPLRGVYRPTDDEPRPYAPPAAGTRVLVLTDVGIGRWTPGGATVADWLQFVDILREADTRPVLLLPFAPERWPNALRRAVPLVQWGGATAAPPPVGPAAPETAAPVTAAVRALLRRNRAAFELAKAVAPAARIDRALLRAARLTLLPSADAGAEADLWLSPLVQARSISSVLLLPEVADELRRLLAADGAAALDRAWAFLTRYRQATGAPFALRHEEHLHYLAVHPAIDETTRATTLLQEALKALVQGGDDRLDVARWAQRAVPRLPQSIRALPVAQELYLAAALRLRLRPSDETVLPGDVGRAQWLLPSDAGTTTVGARLLRRGVQFSRRPAPDMHRLTAPDATPVVLDVRWHQWDGERSQRVALSPAGSETLDIDGAAVMALGGDGLVYLWEAGQSTTERRFGDGLPPVATLAVSPDGVWLATGHRDGMLMLWDIAGGDGRAVLRRGREPDRTAKAAQSALPEETGVSALAFSPDGRLLASADSDRTVTLWRAPGGAVVNTLYGGHDGPVVALAFVDGGTALLAADRYAQVVRWETATGAEQWRFGDSKGDVGALAFSPSGAQMAVGDRRGAVRLWAPGEGTWLTDLRDNVGPVTALAFSPDGARLAQLGPSGVVLRSLREPGADPLRLEPAEALGFSADGHVLVTVEGSRLTVVHVTAAGELLQTGYLPTQVVRQVVPFVPSVAPVTVQSTGGQSVRLLPDARKLVLQPPFDFAPLIDSSRRAAHREVDSALSALSDWLGQPDGDGMRAFVVTGGPNRGKATFSSLLADVTQGRGPISADWENLLDLPVALHFCTANAAGALVSHLGGQAATDPRVVVWSLVTGIAARFAAFGEHVVALGSTTGDWVHDSAPDEVGVTVDWQRWLAQSAETLLTRYLVEPLHALAAAGHDTRWLLLIHGLEQTLGRDPSLLNLLPALDALPPSARFLFVTAPHSTVRAAVAPLSPDYFELDPQPVGSAEAPPPPPAEGSGLRLPQLVDREVERAKFDRLLADDGGQRVLVLAGAPGTGKSFLLRYWLDALRDDPETAAALVPLGELTDRPQYRAFMERLAEEWGGREAFPRFYEVADSVSALGGPDAPNLAAQQSAQSAEFLEDFTGQPIGRPTSFTLRALNDAFRAVLAEVAARRRRLVLLIDDYEAADADMRLWLRDALLPWTLDEALLNLRLVLAGREQAEVVGPVVSVTETVVMGAFSAETVRDWLAQVEAREGIRLDVETLRQVSGGNPALLDALLKQWRASTSESDE